MATVVQAGIFSAASALLGVPLLVGYVLAVKLSEKRWQHVGKGRRS